MYRCYISVCLMLVADVPTIASLDPQTQSKLPANTYIIIIKGLDTCGINRTVHPEKYINLRVHTYVIQNVH